MSNLNGKSMIVTGASSGIGRSIALLLAESGCNVTVADINEVGGNETVAMIEQGGGKGQLVKTDISDEASVKRMVDAVVASYGQLDGACNSAAVLGGGKFLADISVEDWDRCHSVNVRGTFLCNKHQVSAMLQTGGGAIVNISSTCAIKGFPGFAEYVASKSAILGITRAAAVEYASENIRVNAILPGGTQTDMGDDAGVPDEIKRAQPISRLAEPEEITASARWLLSDEASFMTGACIPVDGGMTC